MNDTIDMRDAVESGASETLPARDTGALFSFKGRINRTTYWRIALASALFAIVGQLLAVKTTGSLDRGAMAYASRVIVYGVTTWLGLATSAKRWHDIGKPATMLIWNCIPVVNSLVFLYLGFKKGVESPNEFGEGPQNIKLL